MIDNPFILSKKHQLGHIVEIVMKSVIIVVTLKNFGCRDLRLFKLCLVDFISNNSLNIKY